MSRLSAFEKFRRNTLAVVGCAFTLLLFLVMLGGCWIRPDGTPFANNQHLVLSTLKPGTVVQFIRLKKADTTPAHFFSDWINGGGPLPYDEVPVKSIALAGNKIELDAYDVMWQEKFPDGISLDALYCQNEGISETDYIYSRRFLLGTDKYGRDVLSRLMAGTSVSLMVGMIAVIISLIIGLTVGLVAGYYRGWVDATLMWLTNVVWAIPTLILVMAITFSLGSGLAVVFIAVGLTMWVDVARLVRGQVLSVREKEYIEAARAVGNSDFRILTRHILPNIISPVIVLAASNFSSAILVEAGLSFLGLGAQIPQPSWGNMIREHYSFLTTDLAYLAFAPGVLMMLLVLSFMLIGNGLRDALDVRT
jgi:peptide/nickel transport system permease protein